MADSDYAQNIPYKDQAYPIPIEFRSTTGTLITGTWTVVTATVATNFGTVNASVNSVVQNGTTGMGYLLLAASEMNGNIVQVIVTCSNSNATPCTRTIYPQNFPVTVGNFQEQTTIRQDNLLMDIWCSLCSGANRQGSAMSYLNTDGSTRMTGQYIESDLAATRTEML